MGQLARGRLASLQVGYIVWVFLLTARSRRREEEQLAAPGKRMAEDVTKNLDRARKYLEKNRLREAIAEYDAVFQAYPSNLESIQALGDIHTRLNEPEHAAKYYGLIFDRFAESREANKALVLYGRFLKPVPQPPERIARYALLLQKQNKVDEAMAEYENAANTFLQKGSHSEALACWDKIAQLDPDNPARQIKLGEVGEKLGKNDFASRGYLRAGQLAQAADLQQGLKLFERAHALNGSDRSVCMVFGQALLAAGQPGRAVEILRAVLGAEHDTEFRETYGVALMQAGNLEEATALFQDLYRGRTDAPEKFFELAGRCVGAGKDDKAVEILTGLKDRMFVARKQSDFITEVERLVERCPKSLPLMEFSGQVYSELNRDSMYFGVLEKLFDLYVEKNDIAHACESLDRLVDIDPYDFRNQDRLKTLVGKADPEYVRAIEMRMAKAVAGTSPSSVTPAGFSSDSSSAPPEGARARHALEDMMVQAEIFLQYSLTNKAIEWLQKIAQSFPGEEDRNERLSKLYGQANWWPAGRPSAVSVGGSAPTAPATAAPQPGGYSSETIGDLSKISEVTRAVYRQGTPKTVLSTGVTEIGKHLGVTRCIAVVGPPGQPPQMASEYVAPGTTPSGGPQIVKLLAQFARATPDALGGIQIRGVPALTEMGLDSVLGVQLNDKETQTSAGMLIAGSATPRDWKPNESYFLQSCGDQILMCVNHTKLRSLMRTLAVADVKTGVLGSGSYQDCLMAEANRAKQETAPLSLVILQLDQGPELIRQQGEPLMERYMEQLAVALQAGLRQNDVAVKYTAWSLAFILPNTALVNARTLADKLRKASLGVRPPWNSAPVKLSAAAVEAVTRPDYDNEDIVTDLINRAEFCLEDARKKGGDTIVAP
jgi:tetratricopeptide (TPR) repeat protein/GGDEF domain-containing protein